MISPPGNFASMGLAAGPGRVGGCSGRRGWNTEQPWSRHHAHLSLAGSKLGILGSAPKNMALRAWLGPSTLGHLRRGWPQPWCRQMLSVCAHRSSKALGHLPLHGRDFQPLCPAQEPFAWESGRELKPSPACPSWGLCPPSTATCRGGRCCWASVGFGAGPWWGVGGDGGLSVKSECRDGHRETGNPCAGKAVGG